MTEAAGSFYLGGLPAQWLHREAFPLSSAAAARNPARGAARGAARDPS
jgi:hypothetical protein